MSDLLFGLALLVLLVVLVTWSVLSYRKHTRRAQAKSRAALNRLLAEADEIAQSRRDDPDSRETPS